jgi:hypothetical protein
MCIQGISFLVSSCNKLTPWRRVLLEKITVAQLANKLPAFYGIQSIHYLVHSSRPRDPVLNKMQSVYILTQQFFYDPFSSHLCGPLQTKNAQRSHTQHKHPHTPRKLVEHIAHTREHIAHPQHIHHFSYTTAHPSLSHLA